MNEVKPIPGYAGYFCDKHGVIYSVWQLGNAKQKFGPMRVVKPYKKKNGYLSVSLKVRAGRYRHNYVHRLILQTWAPATSGQLQCNHRNGVKFDNSLQNLEWVTHSANMLHCNRVLNKKNGRGENSYFHKLTDDRVREMRELRKTGMTYANIAKHVDLNESWVWRVVNNKAWSHVE